MPNKYIVISLNLSFTHTFHQHCSSNSLWYRFLRIRRQIKRNFCLYVCLFYTEELTLNLLYNKLINLHAYKLGTVNSILYNVLPTNHHSVSGVLWGHSTQTLLYDHLPCVSTECLLCLRIAFIAHTLVHSSPLDQHRPSWHKDVQWSRNLVNHFVHSAAFLWSHFFPAVQ